MQRRRGPGVVAVLTVWRCLPPCPRRGMCCGGCFHSLAPSDPPVIRNKIAAASKPAYVGLVTRRR